MKKRVFNLVSLFLGVQLWIVSVWGLGTGATNGGNYVGMEFTKAALAAIEILVNYKDELPPPLQGIDVEALSRSISETRLQVRKNLCYQDSTTGDVNCDAGRNLPSKKLIQISEEEWKKSYDNPQMQMALALHEYLGIMRVELNVYYLSAQFSRFVAGESFQDRFAYLQVDQVLLVEGLTVEGIKKCDANKDYSQSIAGLKVGSVDRRNLTMVFSMINCLGRPIRSYIVECDSLAANNCNGKRRESASSYRVWISESGGVTIQDKELWAVGSILHFHPITNSEL